MPKTVLRPLGPQATWSFAYGITNTADPLGLGVSPQEKKKDGCIDFLLLTLYGTLRSIVVFLH